MNSVIMKSETSSLSQVLPASTVYYYGYPAELDSGFYNTCPPEIEELVAMRPTVCAGPGVKVVTFASTVSGRVWNILQDDLGVPLIKRDQVIEIPSLIDLSMKGSKRNEAIKRVLADSIPDGQLVMAQPYIDKRLNRKYRINPLVTTWLNDKDNIGELVPSEYQVPELANVCNGKEFTQIDSNTLTYPCVVKVSSSSAGDGVKICKTSQEFRAAQEKFKNWDGHIIVQKYIDKAREVDVKFALYPDINRSSEMLGHSREITGANGEYLGGIIQNEADPVVQKIYEVLRTLILPTLQQKGWFGVGGVDVLIDKDGKFYFSDFNCRMTATMAQTLQANAGLFKGKSTLVFNGKFMGTLDDFQEKVISLARHGNTQQSLNVVSLANRNDGVQMHAGVLFDQEESLRENIVELQRLGIHSDIFTHLNF